MSGEERLRVGTVTLRFREPGPVGSFGLSEPASLHVSCPGCGRPVTIEGDVEWVYHDDDRVVESEDGYAGTLTGDCPACSTGARAEVRLSLTVSRFMQSRELTWDSIS